MSIFTTGSQFCHVKIALAWHLQIYLVCLGAIVSAPFPSDDKAWPAYPTLLKEDLSNDIKV